jgi:predicted nucleic acid-binding protein
MITIMPCLEVMRSVTDRNIDSAPSKIRVESFQIANELIAEVNAKILIPSQLYDKVSVRLNDEQKTAFETLYCIDNSTKAVTAYDLYKATKLIANAESKAKPVIILTENLTSYSLPNGRIKVMKPKDFIEKVNVVRAWKRRGIISDMGEALLVYLFRE